jgi:dethiobiotin synthetase
MKNEKYFVTAIDTDSGKTLVSSILCEALRADYWKPVQAGTPRDSDTVKNLVSNGKTLIHPERHFLKTPASPHAAAKLEGLHIRLSDFSLPVTGNTLVIEGAGGCLVPLNDEEFVIDLVRSFQAKVIVVSDLYLGSINHTLLTIEALNKRKVNLKGIVFNGEPNPESERIILHHAQTRCLLRINRETLINRDVVRKYAALLNMHNNE